MRWANCDGLPQRWPWAASWARLPCTFLACVLLALTVPAYAQTPSELLSSIETRLQNSIDYSLRLAQEVQTWRASSMKSEEAANALKADLQKQIAELASLRAELETWPPRYEEIAKQASALLDLVKQLQEKVRQLSGSFESTVASWRLALTGMTRERDLWRLGAVGAAVIAVAAGIWAAVK